MTFLDGFLKLFTPKF